MKKKTLSIVLDAFIVLLVITIIFLIVLIVRRGEAPIVEQQAAEAEVAVVEEPTAAAEEENSESAEEEQAEEDLSDAPIFAVMSGDGVNVRAGAGTGNDVLGVAAQGDEYRFIKVAADGWICVEYRGGEGYIFGEYLTYYRNVKGEKVEVKSTDLPADSE